MMSDDDKPFACSSPGCGMRFTNEDHLTVHMRKHEMSLALNTGNNTRAANNIFLDQTPTPTKFLRNCEEIGLFQELTKNPFEEAFKKASEPVGSDVPTDSVPLPGPHSNEVLHTPVASIHLKTVETIKVENEDIEVQVVDESSNETSSSLIDAKNSNHTPPTQPTSTTSDDDVLIVSTSQSADSSVPTPNNVESAVVSTPTCSGSVIETSTTPLIASSIISPQYTMQVYLQLPSGQTVPVQIPATITNSAMQVASIPVPPSTPKSSPNLTQPSLAKQKLKAALQSNQAMPQDLTTPNNSRMADTINHIAQLASPSSSSVSVITETASMASDATASSPESLDTAIIGGVIKRQKRSVDDDPDERRRKFLERNRAAAARCRQKRKQWITNLEKKAEELQNTNSRLQGEVNLLRTEVAQLKSILLAHKDCPITLQQKSMGQLSIQTVPVGGDSSSIIITSAISSAADSIITAGFANVITPSAPVSSTTSGIPVTTSSSLTEASSNCQK